MAPYAVPTHDFHSPEYVYTFVTTVKDRSCKLHMSIAVAADIKNWPSADNMNPINWNIKAAISDVPLKRTLANRRPGGAKWQRVRAPPAYHSVRSDAEQLLSHVYPNFSGAFVPVSGSFGGDENFLLLATKEELWPSSLTSHQPNSWGCSAR